MELSWNKTGLLKLELIITQVFRLISFCRSAEEICTPIKGKKRDTIFLVYFRYLDERPQRLAFILQFCFTTLEICGDRGKKSKFGWSANGICSNLSRKKSDSNFKIRKRNRWKHIALVGVWNHFHLIAAAVLYLWTLRTLNLSSIVYNPILNSCIYNVII